MFIDDMIALNLDVVFPGFIIDSHYAIRVSRDADFSIEAKEVANIVDAVRKRVKRENRECQSTGLRWLHALRYAAIHLRCL